MIVAASATDCNLLLDRSSLPRTDGIAKQVRNLRRSLPSGLSLPELPLCFTLGVNGFLQPRKLLLTQLGGHLVQIPGGIAGMGGIGGRNSSFVMPDHPAFGTPRQGFAKETNSQASELPA